MGKATVSVDRMPHRLEKKVLQKGTISVQEAESVFQTPRLRKRSLNGLNNSNSNVASRTRSHSQCDVAAESDKQTRTNCISSPCLANLNANDSISNRTRKRWSSERREYGSGRRWKLNQGITSGMRNLSLTIPADENRYQYALRSRGADESDSSRFSSAPTSPAELENDSESSPPPSQLTHSPIRESARLKRKRHLISHEAMPEVVTPKPKTHNSPPVATQSSNRSRRSPLAPLKCGCSGEVRSRVVSSSAGSPVSGLPVIAGDVSVIPFRRRRRRRFYLPRSKKAEGEAAGEDGATGGRLCDIDARTEILNRANLAAPLTWEEFLWLIPKENIAHLGDGDFAQVYKCECGPGKQAAHVLKLMAVSDNIEPNAPEVIREYSQYLPEVVVSQLVSDLPYKYHDNRTNGFVHLDRISVVTGKFPKQLSASRQKHTNEEDSFSPLPSTQEWLVLEYPYAGEPLDKIETSALPPVAMRAIVAQVALSLAAGEQTLELEHRDLHLGNILVQKERDAWTKLRYRVAGINYSVVTEGFTASIIDYTLTRARDQDGTVYFVDFKDDEEIDEKLLSEAPHLKVHLQTKELNRDRWDLYNPTSNVLWLKFLIATFSDILNRMSVAERLRKKDETEAIMSEFQTLLENLEKDEFDTCTKVVTDNFFFDPFRVGTERN